MVEAANNGNEDEVEAAADQQPQTNIVDAWIS
jgi:hypothetical protein